MRTVFAFPLAVALAAAMGTAALAEAPSAPSGPSSESPRLAALVDRAWSIDRQGGIEAARAAELDARALANRAFFAGAPIVGFDVRRDLPRGAGLPGTDTVSERGRNELEPGVSAPIWLPGQREAQRRLIEREREALSTATRLERLRLAGQVREAAWAVALSQGVRRLQQARLDAARGLETDVERRVAAGDLAPVDLMLARAERLAAEAAQLEADATTAAARAGLRRLTGADAAGDLLESPAAPTPLQSHPALAAAREAAEASRARLDYARATRRDIPSVSAVARFDRDGYGTGYRNTLRVGIAIPLDTEARNAPRLAAASADLTEAEIALDRRQREVAADIERARIGFDAQCTALEAHVDRARVAREAQAAIERAFRAGERGLPELLRLRAQTFEAEFARDTARERLGLAIARLNQAQGIEP